MSEDIDKAAQKPPQRFLGSLRDALAAASREDPTKARPPAAAAAAPAVIAMPPPLPVTKESPAMLPRPDTPSAAEAAREARGGTPNVPPVDRHFEAQPPTTQVVRGRSSASSGTTAPARTQLVRGKLKIARQQFHQDPVVGWLVIVGGPGLGAHRPIYEGNNTLGRAASQRIPIDFGDDAISSEEQAYIRYDSAERSFLFVPNLAKTNVVSINDKRPTAAVTLQAMDVIVVGRTQLVFVPFCGAEFDWSMVSESRD